MAIEIRDVNKSFGEAAVLKDVSVDVASGSLTALLGPSGGGKSTLLRVIAGLERPDSGQVVISGKDATRLPPQRRGVGFVFQHYAAFKHLTVFENVAFGLKIRKRPKAEIKKRVEELLELVHLDQFAARYPAQLSGGQRQRMALARALAVNPDVLLLDEPFGALDAQVRKELRTWLRRLHDEVHVTTVFVTHDQEEAIEVADTIVVLADGVVQQAGAPADIYDNPASPFVMRFLGPVTEIGGRLLRPHDVVISSEPGPGTRPAVITRVVRLGFETRVEFQVREPGGPGEAAEPVKEYPAWAQMTRESAGRLSAKAGAEVHVRPSVQAATVPAS
ncbi:sulfate ABC transporter ATP-binding protein [Actinomadura sp. KC216]|uniref:sulfate/molybdate ABC transporter ATP-binding protein n=1 Tax=Actinomadura sp. KC216 TaxID=2530370 RepID=UPI00104FA07D|nr:sulfate ABC transporter ATP-binding protein [Actinomadura sp. KC216]TDB76380.1 sulfate ABC transporter ATP-binding protein [Actinomadura sp. KC216]